MLIKINLLIDYVVVSKCLKYNFLNRAFSQEAIFTSNLARLKMKGKCFVLLLVVFPSMLIAVKKYKLFLHL